MKQDSLPPRPLNQLGLPAYHLFLKFSLLARTSVLVACLALTTQVLAQVDLTKAEQSAELEKEYQSELDKWMLRAYEGDRDAQFKVGVLFTNDQFNQPDYEQAVYWYKQAARQGHVLAQYNLGHQYLTGVGVSRNEATAMGWWLKAAKQDHALAQFNIGRAYYLGIGFEKNHALSRKWFELAAANNEPKSIDILQQLGWTDAQGALAVSKLKDASVQHSNSQPPDVSEAYPSDNNQTATELPSVLTAIEAPNQGETLTAQTDGQVIQTQAVEPALGDVAQETSNSTPASVVIGDSDQTLNQEMTKAASPHLIPIALYTNPAVRSVLIALIDGPNQIIVQRESGPWSIVKSSVGFPVWVHGDFIIVDGDVGKTTGTGVNARSVPIVTNGTVVGKLDKDEMLAVIDQRDGWFRVVAPARFQAWVKTADLERQQTIAKQLNNRIDDTASAEQAPAQTDKLIATETITATAAPLSGPRSTNDNDWLFNQAPETYTLQLASFDNAEKIKEFESRAKFINNPELHRFTATGKGIDWTYYLYGAYPNTELAASAKLKIKQKRAWVRNFGLIQQNRCVAWKTQLPTPKELNSYCVE